MFFLCWIQAEEISKMSNISLFWDLEPWNVLGVNKKSWPQMPKIPSNFSPKLPTLKVTDVAFCPLLTFHGQLSDPFII